MGEVRGISVQHCFIHARQWIERDGRLYGSPCGPKGRTAKCKVTPTVFMLVPKRES